MGNAVLCAEGGLVPVSLGVVTGVWCDQNEGDRWTEMTPISGHGGSVTSLACVCRARKLKGMGLHTWFCVRGVEEPWPALGQSGAQA